MNEEDLHLAKAIASMNTDSSPKSSKKTLVSKVQEKIQGFRWVILIKYYHCLVIALWIIVLIEWNAIHEVIQNNLSVVLHF